MFKIKKRVSVRQRHKRARIRTKSHPPRWIIVIGSVTVIGFAATYLERMGILGAIGDLFKSVFHFFR